MGHGVDVGCHPFVGRLFLSACCPHRDDRVHQGLQFQEGRLGMRQVEEARLAENDKWIAFYDAQYVLEKARWNVLRLTGDLVDSVR